MRLNQRTAVVTGGTKGLGRAIAQAFLAEGGRVLCASRDARPDAELVDRHGDDVAFHPVDVRDDDSVRSLMDAAVDRFGGVDILVANAGVSVPSPVASLPVATWSEVFDTNVTGVLRCIQQALPALEKSPAGRIIAMSSVLASRPVPGGVAYCASKSALETLVKVTAVECAGRGITVNCLAPGFIDEGMGVLLKRHEAVWSQYEPKLVSGRMGSGAEVAEAAVFLAADSGSYVNGHVLEVTGGMRW